MYDDNIEKQKLRLGFLIYTERLIAKIYPHTARDDELRFTTLNQWLIEDNRHPLMGDEIETMHRCVVECNDLLTRRKLR